MCHGGGKKVYTYHNLRRILWVTINKTIVNKVIYIFIHTFIYIYSYTSSSRSKKKQKWIFTCIRHPEEFFDTALLFCSLLFSAAVIRDEAAEMRINEYPVWKFGQLKEHSTSEIWCVWEPTIVCGNWSYANNGREGESELVAVLTPIVFPPICNACAEGS